MKNFDYGYEDSIEDEFNEEGQRELEIINEYEKEYGEINIEDDGEVDFEDNDIIIKENFNH